jgi:hypothetical protein
MNRIVDIQWNYVTDTGKKAKIKLGNTKPDTKLWRESRNPVM